MSSTAADLIALTKPRLSALVIATTAGGLWMAPGPFPLARGLVAIIAVSAVVGGAQALNCYYERDTDRFMARTRNRPLPAGRMDPQVALWFGFSLAAVALPVLFFAVNPLTALLGLLAFLSYVFVYTPMKRRSPAAMVVGAFPGALPPLMGWTAATGRIEMGGLVLFAILFLWQIPHFIAIVLFRREEYERAGIQVISLHRTEGTCRAYAVMWTLPLVAISVLPFTLNLAGVGYLVAAVVLGLIFLGVAGVGFIRELGKGWARQLFFTSLVYLTGLFLALMLDAGPRV
jgi:protoheme IX farnesyltransferase